MVIQVEFTGAAREIAGRREVSLTLPDTATYRDVIRSLAQLYPGLVGMIIAADHSSLLSAMIFDRNGGEAILPGMFDQSLQDGDRLILLYFIVGG
jgi:molybdopterin converting factor small subunit